MCVPDDPHTRLRDALVEAGLLVPSGVRGIYGRSGVFEHIVEQFEALVSRRGRTSDTEIVRFPPIFNRAHYLQVNHIHQFPDLLGSLHTFAGKDRAHRDMLVKLEEGGDWTEDLVPTEAMMIPAACYPLYPSATGTLADGGRTVDLRSYVFRHEPSDDPARMQIFRQREYVRLGTADEALAHRDHWLATGKALLQEAGLPVEAVVANDPFFGRGGRLAKATQREQALKYELIVPISSTDKPTAISSCNYHTDAFGQAFGIHTADGGVAHTACVGFGLERVTLALLATHGFDPDRWPADVRDLLEL